MSRGVRYHVVSKIAHGGMAEIFLAVQQGAEGFQKQVVLKRILPALAADPSFVRMLVDEAHIASTLNHSNLVQVLDLGKSGDQFFLVLEFVDGWSLEQARRRAQKARIKLPLPLSLYVVGSLCRALAYVHTRKRNGRPLGIVHRDVTPQNVLLSREGEVKLADFGIAKAIGKGEKSATGVIKGKFAYMSPEQSIGGELDARSDLFSVGTVLYLLATGRKPFDGATDLDVLMQVRKARYEKPSTIVKDFSPEVERFIARALRSDRARRWQSAEQMADRIDAILLKLGQTTGSAALKRWLENLSAKDGARPPAEMAERSVASDIIELGSRDLELEEVVAPSPLASEEGAGALDEVSTRPQGRRPATAPPPAPPPPRGQPLPEAGAPAITTTGPSYAEYGLDQATEFDQEPDRVETASLPTTPPPAAAPMAAPAGQRTNNAAQATASAPSAGPRNLTSAAAAARAAATPARRSPPPSTRPSFWFGGRAARLRRTVVAAAALMALAGGAYLGRSYLAAQMMRPMKSWLQERLPAPVGGPDWTGDPRVPESNTH